MRRVIITDGAVTRSLILPATFSRAWRVVEILSPSTPTRKREPEVHIPEEAGELAVQYNEIVPTLFDRARRKFGHNTSLEGLITLIKARGL